MGQGGNKKSLAFKTGRTKAEVKMVGEAEVYIADNLCLN